MSLSSDLVSEFVKITNDNRRQPDEKTVYGTVSTDGSQYYVKIDGSDQLTPVSTTSTISDGDRVRLNIRDHTAIVTGNVTDPAVGVKTANGITSKIEQTAEQIRTEVSDEVNGLSSKITQNSNSITSVVSKQEEFSQFQQTVEGFSFMGKGGTVKISGGDITLTGAIKFSDLSDSSTVQSQIDTANSNASAAKSTANDAADTADNVLTTVSGITITEDSTTYIDGDMIYSGSVSADAMHLGGALTVYQTLYGIKVGGYLGYDSGFNSDSGIGIRDSTEASQMVCTNNAARLSHGDPTSDTKWAQFVAANSGSAFVEGSKSVVFGVGNSEFIVVDDHTDYGCISPSASAPYVMHLGRAALRWGNIYAENGEIQVSDRNMKNSIEDLPEKYITLFDNISPKRFKMNAGTSGRYHTGYIAQEVEDAMTAAGIDSQEFAGFIKDKDSDGNDIYMLRYDEFAAIRDAKIKQLETDILALKTTNEELKARIEKLEKLLTENT